MTTIIRTAIGAAVLVAASQVASVAHLGAAEANTRSPSHFHLGTANVDQAANIRLTQYSNAPNGRYRWHNGHWWYWLPSNQWAFWNGASWIVYAPDTYAGYYASRYPQYRTGYYSPGYNTGYYAPRYYGGYYPRGYGGRYYARRGYYGR